MSFIRSPYSGRTATQRTADHLTAVLKRKNERNAALALARAQAAPTVPRRPDALDHALDHVLEVVERARVRRLRRKLGEY